MTTGDAAPPGEGIDAQVGGNPMPIDPQSPVPAGNSDMPMMPPQGQPPQTPPNADPLMTGGSKKQIQFMTKDGRQISFTSIPGMKKAWKNFMSKL